jgi:hypothetical protein
LTDPPFLTVTIDTEADDMWSRPATLGFRNTRNLGRLQRLFDELGVRPTYLVTHEVATDPPSAAFLRDVVETGRGEVGSHLHPWSNPPFVRLVENEHHHHPYPHDYAIDVFRAKMQALGAAIGEAIGVEPRSYRAGRWGFVAEHAPVLQELGYVVDTSVTPGVSWERYPGAPGGRGGVSCLGAPRVPYRLDGTSTTVPARGGLLEIPVSIEWSRALPAAWTRALERRPPYGLLARTLRHSKLLRPVWLRPYPRFAEDELVGLVDRLRRERRPVWNVMFHSSEAVAGTSPYSPDEASLDRFYRKLRVVLERALAHGAGPSGLTDAARSLEAAGV